MSILPNSPVSELPFAFGGPPCTGVIRAVPEDFLVDEISLFDPDGEGEHLLLRIEKRNTNTEWVAGLLARHAGVPRRDVSYAGQKDRNAVTRQWFSVRLAGQPEPDWRELDCSEIKILESARHGRKLRTGALKGNRFTIRVSEFDGDQSALKKCLARVEKEGVPNYFGEQRFGREGGNIASAEALFRGELKRLKRQKRGIYLSAARSLLFNRVLAFRVTSGSWNTPLPGERLMLDGSRSSFLAEQIDSELEQRYHSMDIHTSGPLWGQGDVMVSGKIAELEAAVVENEALLREGLERYGLKMERRALRMPVSDLNWSIQGTLLTLEFSLPKGSFATSFLRECVSYR